MTSSPWHANLERMKEILRYEGLHFLLWRMMVKCLSPWGTLGLANFYAKDLTRPLEEAHPKVDTTITQATEGDIEQLVALVKRQHAAVENSRAVYLEDIIRCRIIDNFRRGQRCFIGKIGNQIVHYNWIFFHWMETIMGTCRFIHLKDNEAFLNDAYTLEEWRGKSIHTVVQRYMLHFLQKAGYHTAYTVVPTNNKSSMKTHHRLGWKRSGTMLYFIPLTADEAKIWRISGVLDPFVEKDIPRNLHAGGILDEKR